MDEVIRQRIEKLIHSYERQMKRNEKKEKEYESRKEDLTIHGYWSLGSYGAKAMLYADVIDDLRELIEEESK